MKRLFVLILSMILCLSGCTFAPKYRRPLSPVPDQWPAGPVYPKAKPTDKIIDVTQLKWREFFTDPELQQVIRMALENNRDLRLAALNVEKARALYGVQQAQLFPALDAAGELTKQRTSSDFLTTGQAKVAETYSVDLGITSWEVDFFGRIRNLTKQALEEYLATEEARRSAQISLISEVARAYLAIAADQANFNLARSTLETQQGAYSLILKRYKVDLVGEIDLLRTQTQVDTARGDLVTYTQQIAQDKNSLNLLVGASVPENLLPGDLTEIKPFRDIFPGLSSKVLLKRPDIMSAEHQLKGAYANIGAARAAFFPSISMTTALGSASNELSGLFSPGRASWVYSPQVTMPIFDMRIWAAYRVSEATRKIALTTYEKAIQSAFKEVADVLAVQGTVDQQIAIQQSMVDAAEKVYRLSGKRYTNGIDSYLSVLDAQRSLYSAQQELISMQLSKLANEVKAYAVLGGGAREETDSRRQGSRASSEEKAFQELSR